MRLNLYFRRPRGYSFHMPVDVKDDRHGANVVASMVRRGFEQVSEETYLTETRTRQQLAAMARM